MIAGRDITTIFRDLQVQKAAIRDFLADTRSLRFETVHGGEGPARNRLSIDGRPVEILPLAHRQIAETVGIPWAYYERMQKDAPELLARNANQWLAQEPSRRLVRTFDAPVLPQASARAFLSDRYQRRDHVDLVGAIMPTLAEQPDMRVESAELTEKRLYIQAVYPRIEGRTSAGDRLNAGIIISNSEVGEGAVSVRGLVYTLACRNGMVSSVSFGAYHVGRRNKLEDGDNVRELLSDEALQADDRAFWLKVRDVVRGTADRARFEQEIVRINAAAANVLPGPAKDVVQAVAELHQFSEGEADAVLQHLIDGGQATQWGLASAITRAAQDSKEYDRAVELETIGGRIVAIPAKTWEAILN